MVTGLLGFFGYRLSYMLLEVFNAAIDWGSLGFMLWNFVIVGVSVLFWKGPVKMKQGYAVIMSSMMVE